MAGDARQKVTDAVTSIPYSKLSKVIDTSAERNDSRTIRDGVKFCPETPKEASLSVILVSL